MEESDGRDWQELGCFQWKGAMDVQEMLFFISKRFGALKKTLAGALLHVEPENLSSASKRPRVHPPALFEAGSSSASPDVAVSD